MTITHDRIRKQGFLLLVLWSLSFAAPSNLRAQNYIIEPQDKLKITFWDDKDLNTEPKVSLDGNISLPIVGSLKAAGMSPQQLSRKISEKMSLYGKVISNVTVEITEYGSKRIYVTGEVGTPGKYSFERMPNLWEIILEAGGPTPSAMLGNVAIIRRDAGGKVDKVDLASAIENGKLNELPKIRPGDTIHVSKVEESGGGKSSPIIKSQVVYVFGAVGNPGAHFVDKDIDVLEAIVRAGGPSTDANLTAVSYISKGDSNPVTTKIDLQRYIDKSIPNTIRVKPGDSIFVPRNKTRSSNSLLDTLIRVVAGATLTSIVVTAIQ